MTVVSLADNPSGERIPLLRDNVLNSVQRVQSCEPAVHTQSDPPQIKEQIRDGNGNIKQHSQIPNCEKHHWHSDCIHSEMKICSFVAFSQLAHSAGVYQHCRKTIGVLSLISIRFAPGKVTEDKLLIDFVQQNDLCS